MDKEIGELNEVPKVAEKELQPSTSTEVEITLSQCNEVSEIAEKELEPSTSTEVEITSSQEDIGNADTTSTIIVDETFFDEKKRRKCPKCRFTSRRLFNLKRHIQRNHGHESVKLVEEGKSLCTECGYKCRRVEDLRSHLSKKHGLQFQIEEKVFHTLSDYEEWCLEYEATENTCFTGRSTTKNTKGEKVCSYQCHRTGHYRPHGKGLRRLKAGGTMKINNNCTCTKKVTYKSSGDIHVVICHTHYAHTKDMAYNWLPKAKRKAIAARRSQGITKDKILDDVCDNVGKMFEGSYLAGRKDLTKICKAFEVDNTQRHPDDQQSVVAWIEDFKDSEENPILYYKMPGVEDEQFEFSKEDFVIMVQTNFQRHLLRLFGNKGLCCDATDGPTGCELKLTSLLVVDNFGECCPVAWCLSNRDDLPLLQLFFELVKNGCGDHHPNPPWFMTDVAPQFYNAFCLVFEVLPKQLYCTCHVEKTWRESLKEVKDVLIAEQIYKHLRAVLEQTSAELFHRNLSILQGQLSNSKLTQEFGEYFDEFWVAEGEKWAYYARSGLGINACMFCESFHRVSKHLFRQQQNNPRVDRCLINLIKYNRCRYLERLVKVSKFKTTNKVKQIQERHQRSMNIPFNKVRKTNESEWLIESEDGKREYQVNLLVPKCTDQSCQLRCSKCCICIHNYVCTCKDHLLYATVCKHVHLLHYCRLQTPKPYDLECPNEAQRQADVPMTEEKEINMLSKEGEREEYVNVDRLKANVIEELEQLKQTIMKSESRSMEAYATAQKSFRIAMNTFESLAKRDIVKTVPVQKEAPKKLCLPRLHPTLKKKIVPVIRLATPTQGNLETLTDASSEKKTEEVKSDQVKSNQVKSNQLGLITDLNVTEGLKYVLVKIGVQQEKLKGNKLTERIGMKDMQLDDNHPPAKEFVNKDIQPLQQLFTKDAWQKVATAVGKLKNHWTCSRCKTAKHSNMICCDACETWYHWECAGVTKESSNWVCGCQKKSKESHN